MRVTVQVYWRVSMKPLGLGMGRVGSLPGLGALLISDNDSV